MQVIALTVGIFNTNCYLVSCSETGDTLIIDPGARGKHIAARCQSEGLQVVGLVNTHAHLDHIMANGFLCSHYSVPLYLHPADLPIYGNPGFGLRWLGAKQPQPNCLMQARSVIKLGNMSLSVLGTPGHTPGSVCLYGAGNLFCGDTLFKGSARRTDLTGGCPEDLICSLRTLVKLPRDTIIWPGHGPPTIMDAELKDNYFLKDDVLQTDFKKKFRIQELRQE